MFVAFGFVLKTNAKDSFPYFKNCWKIAGHLLFEIVAKCLKNPL